MRHKFHCAYKAVFGDLSFHILISFEKLVLYRMELFMQNFSINHPYPYDNKSFDCIGISVVIVQLIIEIDESPHFNRRNLFLTLI